MPLTIYHNPRCSKSRKTLEILENAGASPNIVEYLKTPPSAGRIVEMAALLGVPVLQLLRRNEDVFKEAVDLPELESDAALAAWIASHPKALQRPIVVDDENRQAVIGRPPENVDALLSR
ncbi:MAG: arsenate reductase (glutaredoxin) [Woeseiaceae bacterium]|nr:arsenate reductase (glutaredoxin) [Woeseiaceae bacterium]